MSNDTDQDKQFEPSQKKLDDARKKGEIAKSTDVSTSAAYAGFLICAIAFGPDLLQKLASVLTIFLERPHTLAQSVFSGGATTVFGASLVAVATPTLAWFAVPMVCVLLSLLAQKAIVFAPSKLVMKLNRISPISGAKNKFGRSGLFEFFKSFTKLVIYSVVLGIFLNSRLDTIIPTSGFDAGLVVVEMLNLVLALLFIVLCISALLGVVDFVWQRAEHQRKNRMSRKEMTDEIKQSEGDPMLKQQRRQKGQELANNQMMKAVPDADVVLVNPTHYAVALKWSRLPGTAPECVAKGKDEVAAKIREIANECNIPIHSDPPSTRAIFWAIEIGQEVEPEHFQAVATAIRFAEDIRRKRSHR